MACPVAANRYLLSLQGPVRSGNFGLQRMEWLMEELGHPERRPGIVHIAGTNGKGSTAAMIESGLRVGGFRTGLYTSPHLVRINERYRIEGQPVSDGTLACAVERVRVAIERIVARRGSGSHPTFFEAATAVALVLFEQAHTSYSIVETGLGGRLDASNVVRPDLAVVTRIQADHERFLGADLAGIAAEKAAIVKEGCRAVVARQVEQVREVLLRRCAQVGADVCDTAREWEATGARSDRGHWTFTAKGPGCSVPARLALAGEHQVENALTAAAALRVLGVRLRHISEGLRRACWPGRLEDRPGRPPVLLDAAHNPGGAKALSAYLRDEARGRRVTLVYGSSRDKAVDEIAAWTFPAAHRVVLTRAGDGRAATPAALLAVTSHHHGRIQAAPCVADALRLARRGARADDWIVIAGSLFLVGEARQLLR